MNTPISTSSFQHDSLTELLRWRASTSPDKRIYSFLHDGETESEYLTFSMLDKQARNIGAWLQAHSKSGERALLIYPSGLDFVAAFYACLYSGIIAVPVYPPSATRTDRTLQRFYAIAKDAQPNVILTTSSLSSRVQSLVASSPDLQKAHLLVTNELPKGGEEQWQQSATTGETLAFLQYTSGSTGMPKGVMVSHRNLLHNAEMIADVCQHPAHARLVTWLPLYHDLGLIGGVIQPLYAGFESTILSPTAFLQRPIRWLQALSRFKATMTGAPNFAYDLCVRKTTPEQRETLDLSSLEVAANGAEPVRAETLEQFYNAFAPCGLRREALYPCYGLAEATLFAGGRPHGTTVNIETFKNAALEQNKAEETTSHEPGTTSLVSLGTPLPQQTLLIVNTETFTKCDGNNVGEIWLASPSVAQGYWRKAAETSETFHAYLADTGEGPFLRTGDLGFLHDGELFITGRLKDLIIIRGSNHYPQDIEQTVEKSHRALKQGSGVAFSVDAEGEERLVIVQEIERQYLKSNLQEVVDSIRQAVAEQHELQTYAVTLLKPATLPKTSSGKVQRRTSKESFLDGSLNTVYTWTLNGSNPSSQAITSDASGTIEQQSTQQKTVFETGKSRDEIQSWLTTQIAERLKVNRGNVDIREPFAYYGMDSVQAVSLSADLEDWLGRELSPTLAYEYPTIEALSRYLAGEAISPISLLAPRNEQSKESDTETATDAIAIIGLGCRFPGANNAESFWEMLHEGRDGITEVPNERWNAGTYYDPEQAVPGKMNTRWGGFLSHVDQFDPYFFGISPREATRMDPQQRLLLEVAWETLENAGQSPDRLAGSQTGVFVGISGNDYSRWLYDDPESLDAYTGTGNAHSIAANRLSYVLDLRGPSIAIDTACSSSLVSVHMACQSIRNGECDMALAGGVNLILTPELTITFSQARMMSSEGHCKTFDDSADGYVRSEGCGLVLLKPLSQARKDGDTVLAVIRGSAVNQDGRSNGLTAPNALAQEAVIVQALQNAHVASDQISYVEAHGSSTPLGDPIEFNALKAVLMPGRTSDQPCIVSSVKTNIGHLESAAGIAGLIKTVLSLYHEEIPSHLHFQKLNQHISLDGTTFVIPTQGQRWPDAKRRIAGVSAFGFGGTNAHIIVEAAPPQTVSRKHGQKMERPLHLLTLSAKSESALRTLAQQYADFLANADASTIADICFTANTGRAHFAHRLAITGDSAQQLRERLLEAASGREGQGIQHGQVQSKERTKVAFLFSGQGSQYVGMGRHLYETQPTFRHALDECDRILQTYHDGDSRDKSRHNMGEHSLLSVLYGDEKSTLLNETAYTQPALFALEYALAELWCSWGLVPDAVMGHSVGEYVAACVAGLFSLEDALKLIAERGRLMQALPQNGDMLSVFATEEQIAPVITPYNTQVAIAAVNGPQHIVLSGERTAIEAIKQQLEAQGITTYPMTVSHAFHSPLMEPMLDAFEQVARSIQTTPLRIPLVANLTGDMVNIGETLDASYWRRQTRSAVQFSAGIQTLAEHGFTCFVEVGPATTLLGMAKRCLAGTDASQDIIWLSSLRKQHDDWETLLNDVGTLYVKGVERVIGHDATRGVDSDYTRKHVIFPALPTYPFERDRYWHVGTDSSRPTTVPTGYTDERTDGRNKLRPLQTGDGTTGEADVINRS
ncbi:MAG TPA: beta-ketoacyl synthase, partial [Ktedonobacter sp.]|nr:beta-ketoacyl synthase [Ktedonobacter sp.]